MGRELRDAIRLILKWYDDDRLDAKQWELEDAMNVLRRAVSGWVPGEREEEPHA